MHVTIILTNISLVIMTDVQAANGSLIQYYIYVYTCNSRSNSTFAFSDSNSCSLGTPVQQMHTLNDVTVIIAMDLL